MSLFDLGSVVDDLSDEGALTVTRPAASSYTAGRLDTPTTSTFTISASVQNPRGRDLQRLPEGSRVEDVRMLYTSTELRTQGATQAADVVTIEGETYEVENVQAWGNVAGYWCARVLKTGN